MNGMLEVQQSKRMGIGIQMTMSVEVVCSNPGREGVSVYSSAYIIKGNEAGRLRVALH